MPHRAAPSVSRRSKRSGPPGGTGSGSTRQFATVPVCARRTLSRLGVPAVPVVPDRRGAPQRPDGILGRMTHRDGYRAAP
ncbi:MULTISPECIES: hypothetical protein [Streptomyces]|nr:hypothetical protein [Streptomyces sp. NRRL S-4]